VYFGAAHAAYIQDVPAQPDMPIYFGVTQATYIQDVTAQPDVPIYFGVTQAAYIQDVTAQPDMPIYFAVTQAAYIQGIDDALFFFQLPASWLSLPFFRVKSSVAAKSNKTLGWWRPAESRVGALKRVVYSGICGR
jgi:hypothetical protein